MSSIRQSEFRRICLVIGFVLLFGAMALFATGAISAAPPADEDPLVNESVDVTDSVNESVYLDAEFAEQSSFEAWQYNESGDVIANATVTGAAGATESHEFAADSNEAYRIEVYANASDLEDVWISTAHNANTNSSGLLAGAGGDGGVDLPVPWWAVAAFVVVLSGVVGVVARMEL